MRLFKHHIRHKIADTHASDISIRNVPANHPLSSEFKFISNIPKLLPLFIQQNQGVSNDSKDVDISSTTYPSVIIPFLKPKQNDTVNKSNQK